MDKSTIWQEITKLSHYYNFSDRMSADVMNIYVEHLADMDQQTFKTAVDRHIQHNEWMPKVSQIREAAMLNFVDKAGVPSPAEAWSETSKHLHADSHKNIGTLTAVNRIDDHEWSHAIVRKAAEMLGWQDMWLTRDDHTVSNRARYMDTYDRLLNRLKEQVQHTPDLRDAIKPDALPKLDAPKQETLPEPEILQGGWDQMPEHAKKRLDELRQKMEVK